jgi:excisionase family DNA binding protein
VEQVWAEQMAKLKRVLTIGEVAEMLRVHPTTIYRLVKRGELPGFKVGGNWRINSDALDAWLAEGSHRPPDSSPRAS